MSSVMGWLAGAPSAANTTGNYYENAANQIVNAYGSPAAQQFGTEQQRALQPMFEDQNKGLVAQLNAQGIGSSGAGKADLAQLVGNQSSTLAGAIAPLYQQGLGQYGSIIGQMPGAQNNAYQQAIQQFYQALQTAGAAAGGGIPGGGAPAGFSPSYTGNPATSSTDQGYSTPSVGSPYVDYGSGAPGGSGYPGTTAPYAGPAGTYPGGYTY